MSDEQDAVLDAVFDLVVAHGITGATMRRVADRSGVDGKTLRRNYGSQYGLLMTVSKTLELRRDRRLAAVTADRDLRSVADRRDYLRDVLRALLEPADRRELLVTAELITGARLVDGLAAEAEGASAGIHTIIATALERVGVTELELETQRLLALLDGLTIRLAYPHGPAGDTDCLLRHHIDTLVS
ncbi:TetR family transcriptional regulator C-terminal domain-containing protein [Nocardia sp. NPDC024068]|uniref:TetR family transcriptional regulator C-terminal domain-containing protein n=1 Tax=Nocardia sp. NPDC024068 TaxID=3157197 RepID=UPI0033EE19A4